MNTETKDEPITTRLLSLRHYAQAMSDAVTVAHWVKHDKDPQYHINVAHKNFAHMAEILGYKIERIEK